MFNKIYLIFAAIVCYAQSILWLTRPKWYSTKTHVMIDATNYKVPAFIVTFIIASYLFYKGIKYKTKDDSYLICRNCEQTFAYKDAKPNFTCPKCDIPLVPLQGYFKRKAWKERQKEKNSNTNA